MESLVMGTRNPGKVRELAMLLEGLPWAIKGLADLPPVDEPDEDGDTFEANAIKKALYFSGCFGLPCVADDSGLVVDALDGAPGLHSARYAGEHGTDGDRNAKLLAALEGVPETERTARFVCCAAFVRPGAPSHTEMGAVEGHILFAPRGHDGFGYDPLFVPEGFSLTEDKMAVSHRGRAFRKLRAYLELLR
ncbi:MAG: non-canonical purine NTP pyrophosphatase [Candidatus Hydrogenedentes bacterium]|nr:non-canonical purine NTP pyrophosphatase [Candidatus Hydrogenedentota bacterium]